VSDTSSCSSLQMHSKQVKRLTGAVISAVLDELQLVQDLTVCLKQTFFLMLLKVCECVSMLCASAPLQLCPLPSRLPCSVALPTSSSVSIKVHWDNVLIFLNADCSADYVTCLHGAEHAHITCNDTCTLLCCSQAA
jgi:hypothetical protein